MSSENKTLLGDTSIDGIHNINELYLSCPSYTLSQNSVPKPGTTIKFQELVFLVAAICSRLLRGKGLGPSKPSFTILSKADAARRVQVIRLDRSRSPGLFLTKEMLECEVSVTVELSACLLLFARKQVPSQIDENRITTELLHPLLHLWLMVWTDAAILENWGTDWGVSSLVPGDGGGDIALLVTRGQEDDGPSVEFGAIQVKTPRSCGDADILNFGTSGDAKDDALSRQCIRHLMRCDKSMRDSGGPWLRRPIFGSLTVYPGHFFPVAYQEDTNKFVVCADATEIDDKWPEARDKLQNHMKTASAIAAWAFMLVVSSQEDRKQRWSRVCQKQVDQAVQWTTTAGEQLASPNRVIATLMRWWAAVSTSVCQVTLSLLVTLVPLERFRAIVLPNGDVLRIESALVPWRFPVNLRLPLPDSFHKSYTAQTFVFSTPNIVVKVYDDVEPYAHELAFYERWSEALSSEIPIVRASGRCIEDSKPYLILSNEGQPVTELTEEDRTIIQQTVLDLMHEEGWHHHDLATRNVLRKPSGKLCLIDFGMASKCDEKGCDNYWE